MFKRLLVSLLLAIGLLAIPASSFAAEVKPTLPTVEPKIPALVNAAPGDYVVKTGVKKAKKAPLDTNVKTGKSALALCTSTCYYYNTMYQNVASNQQAAIYANVSEHQPSVSQYSGSYDHSLAELAVIRGTGSGRQIVEVGWAVEPGVFTGSNWYKTHFFVYHWINGVGQGYGTNFVRYTGTNASPIGPGDLITITSPATAHSYGLQYNSASPTGGAWWVSYDGKWVGYFPSTLWTSASPTATFVQGQYMQAFGEVASLDNATCSNMGNTVAGSGGSGAGAAYIGSVSYASTTTPSMIPLVQFNGVNQSLTNSQYSMSWPNNPGRTAFYGGPGAC
jgi:hypothetical protein